MGGFAAVVRERVRLIHSKKIARNFNEPRWRAENFDRANGEIPERSIIIAADNDAVALEEVRARMAPTCSRAEVTKLDIQSKIGNPKPASKTIYRSRVMLGLSAFAVTAVSGRRSPSKTRRQQTIRGALNDPHLSSAIGVNLQNRPRSNRNVRRNGLEPIIGRDEARSASN